MPDASDRRRGLNRLRSVVIAGASLAGLRAAEALRAGGFEGTIDVVGAEPHAPYDRPPLSKEVLRGDAPPERTALRAPEKLAALELAFRIGRRAKRLELDAADRRPAGGTVFLDGGEEIAFDGLVIATGCEARNLPGQPDVEGVFTLRTIDDCIDLRTALIAGSPRVAIVGAGFIGSEVAAACRALGLETTIIEALPVPLLGALGPEMGEACRRLQIDHGVDVMCGVGVDEIVGSDRVEGVVLSTGTRVECDVVVVGIGVRPATAWLEGSGVPIDNGVVCDAACRVVGVPGVVAAGDVARWHNELFDETMRVEHWDNAAAQGRHAAETLLADAGIGPSGAAVPSAQPYAPVPYFWSDQYDRKIQFIGRNTGYDEFAVALGSVAERSFVAIYGKDGRLTGALTMNQPRQMVAFRDLILRKASFEESLASGRRV